jgi:hypothetical protein
MIVKYNPEHKNVLDTFLLKNPFVKPGKMYAYPAYYIGGMLFASLFVEGVCVKVPESLVNELIQKDGFVPFEPMGRKMREWILINRNKSEEYIKDQDIFNASIEFVSSIAGLNLKKKN